MDLLAPAFAEPGGRHPASTTRRTIGSYARITRLTTLREMGIRVITR